MTTEEPTVLDLEDFSFQISEDIPPGAERINQAVFQALGAVSVCWETTPTGIFDSTRAETIGNALLAFIEEESHWLDKTLDRRITEGVIGLVEQSGTNSRDHGFHDDKPQLEDFVDTERGHRAYENALRNFWIAKLDLIHEELCEMLGELRSGRATEEVYYLDKVSGKTFDAQMYDVSGTTPLLKPEGFGIELADVVIRAADLAFLTKLPLAELIVIKHEYNKTRPYKHGRTL